MGLKDLVDDEQPDDDGGDDDGSGFLEGLVEDKKEETEKKPTPDLKHDKLSNDELCPRCGKKGEETEHWYWRCNNDCEVVTYIPTENIDGLV